MKKVKENYTILNVKKSRGKNLIKIHARRYKDLRNVVLRIHGKGKNWSILGRPEKPNKKLMKYIEKAVKKLN